MASDLLGKTLKESIALLQLHKQGYYYDNEEKELYLTEEPEWADCEVLMIQNGICVDYYQQIFD